VATEDLPFWTILLSGKIATTLTEMRNTWTLRDMLDAQDMIAFIHETERAAHAAARKKG
jgi:hypothetical protein